MRANKDVTVAYEVSRANYGEPITTKEIHLRCRMARVTDTSEVGNSPTYLKSYYELTFLDLQYEVKKVTIDGTTYEPRSTSKRGRKTVVYIEPSD